MAEFLLYLIIALTSQFAEQEEFYSGVYRFQHIGIEDGLSQTAIHSIYQDSQGFLWIGTSSGLNKYNGYSFSHYHSHAESGPSLAGNRISAIAEAEAGILWIATYNGVTRFDTRREISQSFFYDPENATSLSDPSCNDVLVDNENRIWIATNSGIDLFNAQTQDFTGFSLQGISNEETSAENLFLVNETVWAIGSAGNIYTFNEQSQVFEINRDPVLADVQSRHIREFDDHLLVGTRTGEIIRIDSDGHIERYSPGKNVGQIVGFDYDSDGRLWVAASENKLFRFIPEKGSFSEVRFRFETFEPRSTIRINGLKIDDANVLWVYTNGNGLYSYSPYRNKFQLINNSDGAFYKSHGNYIFTLHRSQNYLWIGSEELGLERLDLETGESELINLPGARPREHSFGYSTLFRDSNGMIWYLPDLDFAYKIEPESLVVSSYEFGRTYSAIISSSSGEILCTDRDNNFWIYDSIASFESQIPTERYPLPFNRPGSIMELPSGKILIGTDEGLLALDRANGLIDIYNHSSDVPTSIPHNRIKDMHLLSSGEVVIATLGGLAIYDEENDSFRRLTAIVFSLDDTVYAIEEDHSGNLWLSTNSGLIRFNLHGKTAQLYTIGDGLQSNEFNTRASFEASNGRLYFGGINGISAFSPDDLPVNTRPPEIAITDFKVMGDRQLLFDNTRGEKYVETDYSRSYLSISFASLDFTEPQKNNYKYRLSTSDEYKELGTDHSINLELKPGKYRLEVTGTNNDGVWSENSKIVHIVVYPPFWQTPLFVGVSVATLFLIAFAVVFNIVRSKTQENVRLENLVGERTRELSQKNHQLEEMNTRLDRLSRTDHLTGLMNRRAMLSELEAEKQRQQRFGQPTAIIMCDIDHFKSFNDRYGHACGDMVLEKIAALLTEHLRQIDRAARWGGEEFLLMLPETESESAVSVAEKLRKLIEEQSFEFNNQALHVTMTFGVGCCRNDSTLDHCISEADSALYKGKHSGRNCVIVF